MATITTASGLACKRRTASAGSTELAPRPHHTPRPIELDELTPRCPATAKTHVSRAMVKLHARNRAQLVVLAYETGLVPAPTRAARPGDTERAIA
jgi:hypothetical protein